ncbi:N-acyl-L-homoserine lactone synthetase [Thioclava sp. BHET1]|uniref:N-acyl-L-homoserine lactone synthetase n=1 Tax=Thioclava dalianensis TaxID=1185766 RepID=A0A074U7X1_9RHOB|nr:acyl-homoserine-lactone synthase [Thioclava dalianensis]KEP70752.1 N-acyl-L-homoserine lactone synthetase [Thioclava dalianensis]TMV89520.1 N-acyl-L-homoserine lactone synthetase [Thioclava sp. BHET1]SFN09901.1 N-acyl-L-homoserine lactone synthetase [Thioclava dalianensis]
MEATTLSYANLHNHGELFANFFRARHQTFIGWKQWDLPQVDGMEFDQYDTAASRWVAVHDRSRVLAGVRLTPTTHRCGIYSYMIRDAQKGLLESIPSQLLYKEAPVAEHIWECSRIFVSEHVAARDRLKVQFQLIHEMVISARQFGASKVLGLIPGSAPRLARRVGLDCVPNGPVLDIGGDHVCVEISLATKMH